MSEETVTITISLPESLRGQIEDAAKLEDRTVSNFIRVRLKESLNRNFVVRKIGERESKTT